MAFLDEEFIVDTLPKGTGNFEPLPEGWYSATVTDADIKTAKAGNGEYIAVRYTITGPTHQGRVVFGNFTRKHPNPKAELVGRLKFNKLCLAIGLTSVNNTDQLLGGNLSIDLIVKTGEYAGNEVKDWRALEGSMSTPTPSFAAPKPAAAPSKGAPPWAKK